MVAILSFYFSPIILKTIPWMMSEIDIITNAGRFTGILLYRGMLIAPVQRFHHNGTGYDWISPDIK